MQITANGVRLEIEDHGSPAGEPLLLIMGLGMQLLGWPQALNCHLEDDLIDGQLHFDYRIKPGVVARSNALELMKSIGLTP